METAVLVWIYSKCGQAINRTQPFLFSFLIVTDSFSARRIERGNFMELTKEQTN